ncbi:ubiquitin elongating factor core-domain-containing protein [Boletus reticuloceps]|uniref:Ubiquitin elongating factor core-domain-containing protein n=1 Tax=Boletus reticuloceps TaxID=495285 RepID=A0A8I2YV03_9AGAM|nr:ubiquitin elongating factor core-domain-containing protein [Boletus reticuloceps]
MACHLFFAPLCVLSFGNFATADVENDRAVASMFKNMVIGQRGESRASHSTLRTTMTDPQDDADRIRAKRLAKLQAGRSNAPLPDAASPSVPAPKPAQPKRAQTLPAQQQQTSIPSVPLKRKSLPPMKLDIHTWEDETLTQIFKVTLKSSVTERSNFDIVWLKGLEAELASEGYSSTMNLTGDIADRLLISRLELDPQAMSDDLDYVSVLASLPSQMTVIQSTRCSKHLPSLKRYEISSSVTQASLCKIQKCSPNPQAQARAGPSEFVTSLLSLSALSTPLTTASSPNYILSPTEVEPFLQDLARRFEPDNEIDGVLGPVLRQLLFHSSLFRPEGLAGGDSSWRGVVGGMEALVSVKSIAVMFTRLDEWNPPHATASTFETVTLMGPLCRLGVFSREWPNIAQSYFSEPNQRPRNDVESSTVSLRGTVKSLQSSLFHIFNTLVRASPESREAVLEYFATAVKLNIKRAGMQVDPQTVASDSFMVNLQSILLSFAEPFIDSRYSKMDRIDPLYFAVSNRIDVSEETRIKATSEEAGQWVEANRGNAATPNFISEIFYLCNAMGHYGYLRTTQTYDDFAKHHDELQRHHDMINGDGSWIGVSRTHSLVYSVLRAFQKMGKIQTQQLAFRVQLLEPDFVLRFMGFTNFVSTWLIRRAGPKGLHPTPAVELPLPQEVPMSFRVLPEYILEDVVEFFLFVTRHSPDSLDLSGKDELVVFALTFMTSTWYIKNPFLKAKINEAVFYGVLPYGNAQNGIWAECLTAILWH